ncbi:right-handed parallel beta-helix repeat-containing protein, partial [Candidatus Cryptobacteroides sp.]|uniref:right-handed parallel beta-helix repeat-containing protein n=1 Tax=Candidatus Cryptobacteroides sp. TaxID=2952915 RepID=UPI002A7EC622
SYPGIALLSSKDIEVKDVHVYRSGAMALIAEYSENITVDGFSTAQHPGSPRMVTASADATHFVDCKGLVLLENCRFESMLDDATNIHGVYMKVDTLLSSNSFAAVFGHFQQEGNHFAEPGDIMRFVDKATLKPVGRGKLISIDRTDRKSYVIETEFDASAVDAPSGLAIENISCDASVVIRGCTVRYNRARSLLLSTLGDVLVENCDFKSQMSGINVSGDANFWFESGPTRNIVIRNNRFEDLGIGGNGPMPVLLVDPVLPVLGNDFYYHDKIVFTGNHISTFDSQLVYARSVRSIEVSDNEFIDSGNYRPLFPNLSAIDLQSCENVKIEGNNFAGWKDDATVSLHNCIHVKNDSGLKIVDSPNPYFERR